MKRVLLVSAAVAGGFAAAFAAAPAAVPASLPGIQGALISLPPESVSVSTGESRKFEVPFLVEQCKSSAACAKITRQEGRSFEIEGVSAGTAVVTVSGPGISKEFRVTVSSSIMPIYRELSRELGDLPEVGVELADNVTVFSELKAGRIDAFVVDEVVGRYLISKDAEQAQ